MADAQGCPLRVRERSPSSFAEGTSRVDLANSDLAVVVTGAGPALRNGSGVTGESDLSEPCTVLAQATRYELRFTSLSTKRCEYAFPCDKAGLVDIDALTDRRRTDYFYARTMVGKELSAPVVTSAPIDRRDDHIAFPHYDERELAS